ncbi:SapC family protein [Aureimonas sp. SK2]|uniref:SapC family protein n=1 Tax=Aureimonas sp. SK2 TaxID=3015992 RepID=UPI0024448224|nr:SapC family protein [Aureimonas sp. SK2]
MTMTLTPLSSMAGARFRPPEHFGFAASLAWIPVNDTEFHLTAHHLPLAVRMLGGMPRLGALVHPAFVWRPVLDQQGAWAASYKPLALRTHPFVLSNRRGGRPIDEIDVVAEAGLVGPWGIPVCADPAGAVLSQEMAGIHKALVAMRAGAVKLSAALELLRIANVLVPLRDPAGNPAADHTVDAARLAALDDGAAAALATRSFLPLDVAGAILFSRRHFRPERLPLPPARPAPGLPGAVAAQPRLAEPADIVLASLEAMNFALDGSDLFDVLAFGDLSDFAAPPPPDLPEEGEARASAAA